MAQKKSDNYKFDSIEKAFNAEARMQPNNKKAETSSEVLVDTDDAIRLQNAGVNIKNAPKKSVVSPGKYRYAIFTDAQKVKFLDALAQTGIIARACAAAKIAHLVFYYNYQSDPEFRRMVEDAMALGAIAIEDEAKKRALEGIEEDVYFKYDKIGVIRKYSDFLIAFLLKGHFPHKYGNAVSADVGTDALGQPRISVSAAVKKMAAKDIDYAALTDEQLRELTLSSEPKSTARN